MKHFKLISREKSLVFSTEYLEDVTETIVCRENSFVGFCQSVVFSLFPGGPVVITVGFYLLSINSINVVDMVSIYFTIIFVQLCFEREEN